MDPLACAGNREKKFSTTKKAFPETRLGKRPEVFGYRVPFNKKRGFIKRLSKGKGPGVVNQPRPEWRLMMIFDMPTCGACRTCEFKFHQEGITWEEIKGGKDLAVDKK